MAWHSGFLILVVLIMMIVFGNLVVLLAVLVDRDLRRLATNKFIASLAISDLLVGIVVMPLSLYATVNEIHWDLGDRWCQFHLVTGVFSTTASIVHLTAISLDRYFAIMFPTEYQRHSLATSTFAYIIMIWLVSFAVSSTLFMEKSLDEDGFCWTKNPQYLVLSSLLSFFIPGGIVVYLYVKIFRKLRSHRLYIFGQMGLLKRQQQSNNHSTRKATKAQQCLPKVISQCGARQPQSNSTATCNNNNNNGSNNNKNNNSNTRCSSLAAPNAHLDDDDRLMVSTKGASVMVDPPSMELSSITMNCQSVDEHTTTFFYDDEHDQCDDATSVANDNECFLKPSIGAITQCNSMKLPTVSVSFNDSKMLDDVRDAKEASMLLALPKSINNPSSTSATVVSLKVPKWDCCVTPVSTVRSNSSRSSCISIIGSGGGGDISRKVSMNSFDTSMTEDVTDSTSETPNSRKISTWSTIRSIIHAHDFTSLVGAKNSITDSIGSNRRGAISRGRLRKIAVQVTRVIHRKRRESLAIRRETRATGVVAAILIAFLICWIPYFCITVYRGICTGLNIQVDKHLHVHLFMLSSWLGYAHSCFNPIIYTCLNKNFRRTIKQIICYSCQKNRKDL